MPKLIPLTRGLYSLVDDEDFPDVSGFKWHADRHGYARRTVHQDDTAQAVYLHQVIARVPTGRLVDHVNTDPLDNRRLNLRPATSVTNGHNRRGANSNSQTGVRGVCPTKNGRYRATICVSGKCIHIGRFGSLVAASAAVEAARQELVWKGGL